jgi:hypothetical protein
MGEVIPIERAADKEIERIREKQRITREYIEQLKGIKDGHLAALNNPQVANVEFIKQVESEIAEIDDQVKWMNEVLRKSEILISKILDKMENFKVKKNPEIKIR